MDTTMYHRAQRRVATLRYVRGGKKWEAYRRGFECIRP